MHLLLAELPERMCSLAALVQDKREIAYGARACHGSGCVLVGLAPVGADRSEQWLCSRVALAGRHDEDGVSNVSDSDVDCVS